MHSPFLREKEGEHPPAVPNTDKPPAKKRKLEHRPWEIRAREVGVAL